MTTGRTKETGPSNVLYQARGAENHNIVWIRGQYQTDNDGRVINVMDADGNRLNCQNIRISAGANPEGNTNEGYTDCLIGIDGGTVYYVAKPEHTSS